MLLHLVLKVTVGYFIFELENKMFYYLKANIIKIKEGTYLHENWINISNVVTKI